MKKDIIVVVEKQHGLQFVEAVIEIRMEFFFQIISVTQNHIDSGGLFIQR